jgi:hypothetical protein
VTNGRGKRSAVTVTKTASKPTALSLDEAKTGCHFEHDERDCADNHHYQQRVLIPVMIHKYAIGGQAVEVVKTTTTTTTTGLENFW